MKTRLLSAGIIIVIIIFYITACRNSGKWLVKEDKAVEADAMVILMGSIADRVLHSSELFHQGLADQIIMVEESMGAYKKLENRGAKIISNSEQVYNSLLTLGIPEDNILILPGDATSTQMEAGIIRNYLCNKPDIDTLLLVSSASHMRRASMIFEAAFHKENMQIHVICSPSKYSRFNADRWWRSKEDIQKVLLEYLKIGNFLVFERRKL